MKTQWLKTLLYSFGSEAPEEVYWGINELIATLNEDGHNLKELDLPYSKGYDGEEEEKKIETLTEVLEKLK